MQDQSASIGLRNHARLPKGCVVCGCAIQWRRWRAGDWDNVKYCSASCRRSAVATARTAGEGQIPCCAHLAGTELSSPRDQVA